jgi:prepilin-type N-terminal cleavage/methylation domain-containing protein
MSRGATEHRRPGRDRGVTLLEILISTALFSLVIIGVYLLYTTMQSTLNRGQLKTDLQQNARVAMDRMVQEIRMAGYDPSAAIPQVILPPRATIRAATPSCLSFVIYALDRDHLLNPCPYPEAPAPCPQRYSTQVTYDFSGTVLRRREDPWDGASAFSGGSAQPQAEAVSLLTFTYYDAFNHAITPTSITSTLRCPPQSGSTAQTISQLDYGQLKQIRRVAITVQTRDLRPGISPEFYTLTSDVRLRNR